MSVIITRKLSNAFEGALAGGGDPASSPLYVFGPFLTLIVGAGVAPVTFGSTIWMAVLTVFMVSAMYRQIMRWVTDGSGGSGLSEEEFGSWAVKINASITVIEYTLTFLVSMAAIVMFMADRLPVLNDSILGIPYRAIVATALTCMTAWIVNRGPSVSVRVFGPATAAVLLLLWGMILTTIAKTGLHLPTIDFTAFSPAQRPDGAPYLHFTFAGYARILALMTGIEVFANLVAAYSGTREEKSRKAFGSLVIIMGTTVISMIILGPMIYNHTNIMADSQTSLFTQSMDYLLPSWLSYAGTIIGIVVLLSACAAATQGVQNLALGLRMRHYIPARLGDRNHFDVAALPVWLMAILCSGCYFILGTDDETYLSLYAAGVFVLLSMTGWAATKRLVRELRNRFTPGKLTSVIGTIVAAALTTGATFIIFGERFHEGAWSYLIMIPGLYLFFSYWRRRLGPPAQMQDWFGRVMGSEGYVPQIWYDKAKQQEALIARILVPLDGSVASEQILPLARTVARAQEAELFLLTVNEDKKLDPAKLADYLGAVSACINQDGVPTRHWIQHGKPVEQIDHFAVESRTDVIAMTTGLGSAAKNMLTTESMVSDVIKKTLIPVLAVRHSDHWRNRFSSFQNILVALDGSESAESVLPYIRTIAQAFDSQVTILFVPEGQDDDQHEQKIKTYLNDVAETLKREGFKLSILITGSDPAQTILSVCEEMGFHLLMMASHGRGGTKRPRIHLGSVAQKVLRETNCPVFVVPLTKSKG